MKPSAEVAGLVLVSGERSARVASLKLREPWGVPGGESVVERLVRMMRASGVRRVVMASSARACDEFPGVGARVDRALSPVSGLRAASWAGLRVCFERSSPPAAVLVWPVEVPLVDVETLAGLMAEPMLECAGGEEVLWASWAEDVGALTGAFGVGAWPALVSAAWARRWCQRWGGRSAPGEMAPRRAQMAQRSLQDAWSSALEAPEVLGRRVARVKRESAMWWSSPEVWRPYVLGEQGPSDV